MTQITPKLEDLVEFPALIPVKAISHKGIGANEFTLAMVDVTAQVVPGFTSELIAIRASSSGNYYSATLSVIFQHVDQVYALDAALREHPLVRMVL